MNRQSRNSAGCSFPLSPSLAVALSLPSFGPCTLGAKTRQLCRLARLSLSLQHCHCASVLPACASTSYSSLLAQRAAHSQTSSLLSSPSPHTTVFHLHSRSLHPSSRSASSGSPHRLPARSNCAARWKSLRQSEPPPSPCTSAFCNIRKVIHHHTTQIRSSPTLSPFAPCARGSPPSWLPSPSLSLPCRLRIPLQMKLRPSRWRKCRSRRP